MGAGAPPATLPPVPESEFARWVQSCLNRAQQLTLPVTGVMDAATRSAVRSFQQKSGLPADGIVGPPTQAALAQACAQQPAGGGNGGGGGGNGAAPGGGDAAAAGPGAGTGTGAGAGPPAGGGGAEGAAGGSEGELAFTGRSSSQCPCCQGKGSRQRGR
jgi:peptidoglycan hydrolase-like protein with peptidoglycan-binding domain